MLDLLKKVFGAGAGAGDGAPAKELAPVAYKDYRIIPMPRKEAQGLRVAGRIELERDGEVRSHEFVRADVYYGEEDTVAVIIQKAQRIIDEQGEKIFERSARAPQSEGGEQ